MWDDFHFLTPLWFLALVPLGLLVWALARAESASNAWRRVIDPRLLAVLSVGGETSPRRWWPLALLAMGWLIAVLALANPTFERQPVPAFRTDAARVVALDLSRSMLADDLTPTRLDRARYKLADILRRGGDGQVGLVAFAGDAFAVSPLTDDAETILGMVDALSPEIMPVQGSRPDLAIARGTDLLQQAGAQHGEVILLTDDAGGQPALLAAEALRAAGHRLAVIGIGTADGAAVPGVTSSRGDVIARLDAPALRALARAGGGAYAVLSADDADLNRVLRDPAAMARGLKQTEAMQTEVWKGLGPWLVLGLLPFGALAFRRGWVLGLVLLLGAQSSLMVPRPAVALGWNDLWQRRDQQAAQALDSGDYERALTAAEDPARIGAAKFRLGDYAAAAEAFAAGDDAEYAYNRGNALARAGQYEQAIAAYQQALGKDPDHADAEYNKEQVERLLQQQQQQPSGQGQQDETQQDQSDQSDQNQADQDQANQDQANQNQPGQSQSDQNQSGEDDAGQDQSDQNQTDQEQSVGGASDQQQADQADSEQQQSADAGKAVDQQKQPADEPSEPNSEQASAQASAQASEPVSDRADPEAAEQAAADYRDEAAARQAEADEQPQQGPPGALAEPDFSPEELESRQAADQWLRRIPDDPAGLLRRKFLYQYRGRAAEQADMAVGNPW